MNQKTKSTIAIIIFALIALYSAFGIITAILAMASAGLDSVIVMIVAKLFCIFPAVMSIVFIRKNQPKKIAKFRFFIIYAIGTYIPYANSNSLTGSVDIYIALATVVLFLIALFKFAPGPKMYLKSVLGGPEANEDDENTEEE